MTATLTTALQAIAVIEAAAPLIANLANEIKAVTGKDVDVSNMTVAELTQLKSDLAKTHPDNWPDLQFKSSKEV